MDKLPQQTPDITQQNIDRIAALFPSAITETKDVDGNLKKAINFTTLKQLLSADVVDGDECYEFTWVGKKQSIIEGNKPIRKTLRPAKNESKNWDTTENLYIEGDNLEVLKLLQNSYLGGIKMMYFDPPYNTGNDFVYRDNFAVSKEDYEDDLGVFDEKENRLFKNTETNGRYHSDWCSMMYPRLQLARNLLTDDGVIFISIDDNEVHNLKKICDEVFGEDNFICEFIVNSNSTKNNAKLVSISHEYILCYGKNKVNILDEWEIEKNNVEEYTKRANQLLKKDLSNEEVHLELLELVKYPRFYDLDHYTYADKNGVYQTSDPGGVTNGNKETIVIHPVTGKACAMPTGGWRYKDTDIKKLIEKELLEFGADETIIPRPKRYLKDFKNQIPKSSMFFDSQASTKWLKSQNIPFDFSKSVDLIRHLIKMTKSTDIILDCFSGSSTTAHAVMQLNAEDGGNRKFIMVQLPEKTDEKSEAYKAGYKNICEIGKERIRRAGSQIIESLEQEKSTLSKRLDQMLQAKPSKLASMFSIEEQKDMYKQAFEKEGQPVLERIQEIEQKLKSLDTGFRVLKLDETNMKDVYYSAGDYSQQMLLELESNIKEDRTDLDLLFGVMLDWGVPLSLPHITEVIGGKQVHFVNGTDLVACFEENITETVVREIAKRKPLRVVFRDSSFGSSPEKINVSEIFKTLSGDTTIKVI